MDGILQVMPFIQGKLEFGLGLALVAGLNGAYLTLFVLAINLVFRRWLTPAQMGLMWGLVLLRLLVPVAPSSPISIHNLFITTSYGTPERLHIDSQPGPRADSDPQTSATLSTSLGTPVLFQPQISEPAKPVMEKVLDQVVFVIPWIWVVGALTTFLGTLVVHLRFCRKIHRLPQCEAPRIQTLWKESCLVAGVRGPIPVILCDCLEQPAVHGFLHAQLLLPPTINELGDQQIRMIMLHELAHVKRRDIAANWILFMIRTIHWWNPFYWLAASRFMSLREQACDAFAVQRIGGKTIQNYGELLLTLAEHHGSASSWRVILPVSMLGFFSSWLRKWSIRNRLRAIPLSGIQQGRFHFLIAITVVTLVGFAGLTDAQPPEARPNPLSDWFPKNPSTWAWEPMVNWDSDTVDLRVYNIKKALNQIESDTKSKATALLELRSSMVYFLKGSTGKFQEQTDTWAQKHFEIQEGELFLRAPSRVHAEFVKNLRAWEKSGLGQISIETRFIQVIGQDIISASCLHWDRIEAFSSTQEETELKSLPAGKLMICAKSRMDDYLPIAVVQLNDAQVGSIINRAQADLRTSIMQAPKLTVFNGQKGTFGCVEKRHFLVGGHEDKSGAFALQYAEIEEGLKVTIRAVQSSDRKKVHLEERVNLTHIDEVGKAIIPFGGSNSQVAIDIPKVRHRNMEVGSELTDGQSLLLGLLPTNGKNEYLYILLTTRKIILPDEK